MPNFIAKYVGADIIRPFLHFVCLIKPLIRHLLRKCHLPLKGKAKKKSLPFGRLLNLLANYALSTESMYSVSLRTLLE